jgi:hypothetical protein
MSLDGWLRANIFDFFVPASEEKGSPHAERDAYDQYQNIRQLAHGLAAKGLMPVARES